MNLCDFRKGCVEYNAWVLPQINNLFFDFELSLRKFMYHSLNITINWEQMTLKHQKAINSSFKKLNQMKSVIVWIWFIFRSFSAIYILSSTLGIMTTLETKMVHTKKLFCRRKSWTKRGATEMFKIKNILSQRDCRTFSMIMK